MQTANKYQGVYAIKPWWQKQLKGIENILVQKGVHPNQITAAGVGCAALLGAALYGTGHFPLLSLAVAPLAIGRLGANALDGVVARRTGQSSRWGDFFNESCDRLSDTLVFLGLAFNGAVFAPLAWGALVLTLLSSYIGTTAKAAGGKRQYGGLLAKADRMMALAAFSFIALIWGAVAWNWLLIGFIPALLITLFQRYRWISADLKQA